ncbi:YkgJ family cysteine cluster protein [Nanoarchaeota archaeon]
MRITKNTSKKDVLKLGDYQCKGCIHCCEDGSGFLVEDDARILSRFLGISEEDLKKKHLEEVEKFNTKLFRPKLLREKGRPHGRCTFLTKKGCSVHPARPTLCRIGNCSENGEDLQLWFTLNYFLNEKDPESIREFYSYLKAGGKTLPGGSLEEIVPDKEKLKKILNYEILR